MKLIWTRAIAGVLALVGCANLQVRAQNTAFSYQGRLNFNNVAASGNYDFRFRLAADANGNNLIASPVLTNAVPVTNGLFVATLDFGSGVFTGNPCWLQIEVKTNGASSYTTLFPLQALTATPYATFANTASNISGTISSANLSGSYTSSVMLNNPGNSFSGAFIGNGMNLTNVNAASLSGKSAANFWQTGGNFGTTPNNGDCIGTLDYQPLEFKVFGNRALRFEPAYVPNLIGGCYANFMGPEIIGSVIAGGGYPGYGNAISANFCFVGGGLQNVIQTNAYYSCLLGGYYNQISSNAICATLGGGMGNIASGPGAVIGGGGVAYVLSNSPAYSGNIASGVSSVVPGGLANQALGNFSFAAGHGAIVSHDGSFAWADASAGAGSFFSTTTNEFSIRALNGVRIQSQKGIHLTAGDLPLIVRDWDQFSTNAPISKSGIGRWGLFMEPNVLVAGIPGDDVPNRYFQVAKYDTNGNYMPLLQVNQSGSVSASNFVASGNITSPKWNAMNLINSAGPLGKSTSFTTSGGTLIISASGSGYSTNGNASIGMDIKIDGVFVDSCLVYANPSVTHLAFVPKTIVKTGVAAGSHIVSLTARTGTSSDSSDNFCVTIQELPF